MAEIFISYRRVGALVHARALFERLRSEFGPQGVFIDLEGIEYGVDFIEILNQQLNGCQVMLTLIDPLWATATDKQGRRRIDREYDYVRTEIVTALSRGIRTVPVLIEGAEMPDPEDLPEPLRPLTRRNALILDFNRFDAEMTRLIAAIHRILKTPPAAQRETAAIAAATEARAEAPVNDLPIDRQSRKAPEVPTTMSSGPTDVPSNSVASQTVLEEAQLNTRTPLPKEAVRPSVQSQQFVPPDFVSSAARRDESHADARSSPVRIESIGLISLLFSAHGRINRGQWWLGCLLAVVFAAVVAGLSAPSPILFMVLMALALAPVSIKRLHDFGATGWWALTLIVPGLMILLIIILGSVRGADAENQYGQRRLLRSR